MSVEAGALTKFSFQKRRLNDVLQGWEKVGKGCGYVQRVTHSLHGLLARPAAFGAGYDSVCADRIRLFLSCT